MAGRNGFSDILDELLAGAAAEPADRRPGIATPALYRIEPQALYMRAATLPNPAARSPRPPAATTATRRRVLTPAQRAAIDTLQTLGASLEPDFTHDELRRAFRSLALRYHPDRHVTRGEVDKAHMAELFARAVVACEALRAVPPHTMH